jgi:DNA topoisomerase I
MGREYELWPDGRVTHRATGERVRDARLVERIQKKRVELRVPPAYTHVTVAADSRAKVQACGIDARGRRQCIYHEAHTERSRRQLFEKVRAHDGDIRRILRDVRRVVREGRSDAYPICMVLHIMSICHFRIGTERYVRENGSYGLTTLEWRHVTPVTGGGGIMFRFRGKKGVENVAECSDPHVLRYVAQHRPRARAGDRMFPGVSAAHVNAWLKARAPEADVTCKDLRTWHANRLFERFMKAHGDPKRALREVAAALHNTPAVCKKNYIDPALLNRP